MINEEKETCNCRIKGKHFDENDETCIRCKRSEKLLDVIFEIALEKAIKDGKPQLLKEFFKNMPM